MTLHPLATVRLAPVPASRDPGDILPGNHHLPSPRPQLCARRCLPSPTRPIFDSTTLLSHHSLPVKPGPIYCPGSCSSGYCIFLLSSKHTRCFCISFQSPTVAHLHSQPPFPSPASRARHHLCFISETLTGRGGSVDMPVSFRLASIHHRF